MKIRPLHDRLIIKRLEDAKLAKTAKVDADAELANI